MALDKDRLGDAIAAAVQAQGITAGTPISTGQLQTMWRAIAKEIIDEFTGHAVVTSTVAVASVTGVTPGAGASGPGTGSATGNIV